MWLPFSYHKPRELLADSQILVILQDITWSRTLGSRKVSHLEMESQVSDVAVVLLSGNLLALSMSVQN